MLRKDNNPMARKPTKTDDRDEAKKESAQPKSSNTMLIALTAGGALLLCCTCGGIGAGGWFFRDKLGPGGANPNVGDGKQDQVAKEGKKDDGKPLPKPPVIENRK